jgi:hypothetical protein
LPTDFAGLSPKKKRLSRRKMADYFGYFRFTIGKKEYISLRSLAFLMYENGEIPKAYIQTLA